MLIQFFLSSRIKVLSKNPKTRNSGQWTEARYNTFIRSALRKASMRWGPINSVKKKAWVERGKYFCSNCKQVVPLTLNSKKNVYVDHVEPIVDPVKGFQGWDSFIERLFCEEDNLEVLCKSCHDIKTAEEREIRKGLSK